LFTTNLGEVELGCKKFLTNGSNMEIFGRFWQLTVPYPFPDIYFKKQANGDSTALQNDNDNNYYSPVPYSDGQPGAFTRHLLRVVAETKPAGKLRAYFCL